MARLYRPHIPTAIRIEVARRALLARGMPVDDVPAKPLFAALGMLQKRLALAMGCEARDLRLDHDPPLAARPQERRGLGRKTYFVPDANDPDHLNYRPHGPQFEGSHLIKTNTRGDHGQHPDRVLIKKMRRIDRGPRDKPKRKWASRPFQTTKGRSRWKT